MRYRSEPSEPVDVVRSRKGAAALPALARNMAIATTREFRISHTIIMVAIIALAHPQ
jgi:hypothetical protein